MTPLGDTLTPLVLWCVYKRRAPRTNGRVPRTTHRNSTRTTKANLLHCRRIELRGTHQAPHQARTKAGAPPVRGARVACRHCGGSDFGRSRHCRDCARQKAKQRERTTRQEERR